MRVAFVVCVFPPEREPSAVMAAELAQALSSQRDQVRVICPQPNRPNGILYEGFRRRWKVRSDAGSFSIDRVWSWFASAKGPFLGRLLEASSFGLTAAWQVLIGPRPDVVLLETWPIAGQVPVMIAARLRRVPVVNYVKDLYPEAAIAAGLLSADSLAARILRRLDAWVCASAVCNVAISPGMAQVLSGRSARPLQVVVIRDWIDTSRVAPSADGVGWRSEVGFRQDDFVCMFAGTMGRASGVQVLAEVADHLRDDHRVQIVCIGDGPAKAPLQRECARRNLKNVHFFPFVPREDVPRVQSAADVMLLTVAPGVTFSSVPSKVITYWAMAKPVIACVRDDSDIAETILADGLGEVVSPGDASGFVEAICRLKNAGERRRVEIGARARFVAERDYSVQRGAREFGCLLDEFAAPRDAQSARRSSRAQREQ